MWDGFVYENKEKAKEAKEKYRKDDFEIRTAEEDGNFLVYSRREVADFEVEGALPIYEW